MNVVLLILVAIAIPLTVLAALLLFSRSMTWLAPRPRIRAAIFGIIGVLYPIIAVWEAQAEGWRPSSYLQIVMGIAWIVVAISHYKQGVISYE